MKKSASVTFSMAMALSAISILSSCSQKLELVSMPGLDKVSPMVKKGDVITWKGPDGKPMKVQFTVFSPCNETGMTDTCTVKEQSGLFLYSCENSGCSDPELPVGGGYGTFGNKNGQGTLGNTLSVAGPSTSYVGVYCDPTSKTAAVQAEMAKPGQVFQWVGIPQPSQKWYVTVNTGTCMEGTEFGTRNGNLTCTVLQGAMSQNMYHVHVEPCMNTDSDSGMLTIQ